MSTSIHTISQINLSVSLREEIVGLCTRAYEEDFADIFAQFESATHVVAYAGEQLVSHALWVPRLLWYNDIPLQSAYVEAVATEPTQQGRGYASSVLRALATAIVAYDMGALSPSDPVFYARLGWETWRGPLFVKTDSEVQATPNECMMILRLPRTPPLELTGSLTAPWRKGDIW